MSASFEVRPVLLFSIIDQNLQILQSAIMNHGACSWMSHAIEMATTNVATLVTEGDSVHGNIDCQPLENKQSVLTVSATLAVATVTAATPAQSLSTPLPVNVVDSVSPVNCVQCKKLKNSNRKYQK